MDRLKLWFSRLAFPLVLLGLTATAVYFHKEIAPVLENRDQMRTFILEAKFWGPVIFIGLQFLQVAVAIIPGELTQWAGGFIYGTALGTFYSLIGITLGSVFNFYVARILGTRFVEALAGPKNLKRFEGFINTPRIYEVLFLLFLIPGMVKDVLAYIAGLSRMKLWGFLTISILGRLPALALSTFQGELAEKEAWPFFWISLGIAGLLFGLGLLFREKIQAFVGKMAGAEPLAPETKD